MVLRHDLAGQGIMGFTEVIKHFPAIRRLFLETVEHLRETRPDCLVLIDYPGFNIRLAKAAHALGIKIVYYISPQVWAWKKKRIHTLARYVDKMLVIFPFEEPLYKKVGLPCAYVGHPLLDHIAAYSPPATLSEEPDTWVGLLPGSREQEIERLLLPMLDVARGMQKVHPEIRFITPCTNEKRAAQIRKLAGNFPLEIRIGGMYDVLSCARFCLVASGTATLETALFNTPMLILYRISAASYWLARLLVHIKYIGIVNILADREVVPEFIQQDVSTKKILPKALALFEDTPEREKMLADFEVVRNILGDGGASKNAAEEILRLDF